MNKKELICEACDNPDEQLVGLRFFNADKSFCKEYYASYKEVKIKRVEAFNELRKQAALDYEEFKKRSTRSLLKREDEKYPPVSEGIIGMSNEDLVSELGEAANYLETAKEFESSGEPGLKEKIQTMVDAIDEAMNRLRDAV